MSFFARHKIFTAFLIIILALGAWVYSWRYGPYHNYELDVVKPAAGETTPPPGQLKVGVAVRDVTANMDDYDPWEDVNNNNEWDVDVDKYTDKNGNGKFDACWIAGFGTNRPAKGIHDPQWARAIAFQNNGVTTVLVSIDAIGIFHNEFIKIRESLDKSLNIDHVTFSSTHCHETPDTMKIWSGNTAIKIKGKYLYIPIFGYDDRYIKNIQAKAKEAIEEAVKNLQPADMYCAEAQVPSDGYVDDSRKPVVLDPRMTCLRFTKPNTDETIATLVNWGNHPETLSGDNPLLTSDFAHFLREGVEKGVPEPNGAQGFGGVCVYVQGQVGGLMTQLHTTVQPRNGGAPLREASFEKAQHLGENLAVLACNALRSDKVWKNENPKVAYAAKTALAPMQGHYAYAIMLGLIHEGYHGKGRAKTELNVLRVGDVVALTVPGEIYPEIVEGGIVALPGNDFNLSEPVETPPLRTFMTAKAKMAFVVGLANDEVGYLVPKSQWDAEPPFVYDGKDQYGEENSPGPEAAGFMHAHAKDLLQRINAAW